MYIAPQVWSGRCRSELRETKYHTMMSTRFSRLAGTLISGNMFMSDQRCSSGFTLSDGQQNNIGVI